MTDVCRALLSSMAWLSELFAWVSSANWCFESSWLQGPLVGPGCTAAELLGGIAPASLLSKSAPATAFCKDPSVYLSEMARCQQVHSW